MEIKDKQGKEVKLGSNVAWAVYSKYGGTRLRFGRVEKITLKFRKGYVGEQPTKVVSIAARESGNSYLTSIPNNDNLIVLD